jgi:hypothetical protein
MRDQLIRTGAGATHAAGVETNGRVWLELTPPAGSRVAITLSDGELLMAIEALVIAYAELLGARPDRLARGVNRTLRNGTNAAGERHRLDCHEAP